MNKYLLAALLLMVPIETSAGSRWSSLQNNSTTSVTVTSGRDSHVTITNTQNNEYYTDSHLSDYEPDRDGYYRNPDPSGKPVKNRINRIVINPRGRYNR